MESFVKHESTYPCACGSEFLMLRSYSDNGMIEPQVEVAIFRSSPKIRNWKNQIRWIWHIICNKEIWSDEIILNPKQMESLSLTLRSLVEEIKQNENIKTPV